MPRQPSAASKFVFWSLFLALAIRTWAIDVHVPIPITDDGVDLPGGRFSFGKPFHLIWDINEGETGKITFIAEPMVGSPNYTLIEGVDMKNLEVYVTLTPPRPFPEYDTYYIHAANASNPKEILYTTTNIFFFDDKPATATLVVSGSQTTSAGTSQPPPTVATTTNSSTPVPPKTTSRPLSTHAPTSALNSTSATQSTNSSTILPSSTTPTSSDGTTTTTTSTSDVGLVPPTNTPLAATSNRSSTQSAIIGGVIGGIAFILLLMIGLLIYRRHRKHKESYFTAFPADMVPSNDSPPPSKFSASYTNAPHVPQWPPAGMAELSGERHKHPSVPQWPPEGTGVPRERRKFQPGLEPAPAPPVPATPQGDAPDVENEADSEEDAQRLRSQAEAMNERIAELESQLVRGLDIGRQLPPGYVSQRQSIVPF